MSNSGHGPRLSPTQRREHIIDVAALHLAHGSYEALSVQEVAVAAGVTRALVHHYFGGKDALFQAVVQREIERLLEATSPDPRLSAEEQLNQALGAYIDFFAASTGELRRFFTTAPSAHANQGPMADAHKIQVDRIAAALEIPDSPRNRIAIAAWLMFVVEAAKESSFNPEIERSEVLGMCRAALMAAVT
ncbi:TetR/AcrR family transcriptional regulator [Paeniglutamicibacter sp. R2-26]|uniref:TetR/AcrR family transcriptional regulator n=1 Tax=Paeniglutamicibacter sp. R2-26 TaxID=3144417 RepID=UPI003EE44EB2